MEGLQINQYLREYVSKDYAGQDVTGNILLDCSLGVNSDPIGDGIFERIYDSRQIKYYPHDETVRSSLADWYLKHGTGEGWLSADNFLTGNGSYDILTGINMMCLTGGKTVLGHAPQFTAYVDSVYCTGSDYRAVKLPEDDNFRFDTDAYLAAMTEDVSLFIIENPNNPTGQKIPLGSIAGIAGKALSMNKILVVDEAYADYLPFEDSAVNLADEYPNIIVTRSFSKGWGMAGLRLGYAVASRRTDILFQLQKIVLPFNSNAVARALAVTALESGPDDPEELFGIRGVREQKKYLADRIADFGRRYGRYLRIAETHDATPILMLYYPDGGEGFDLCRHMLDKGLLTVDCASYEGLDSRAVRIMLPEREQTDLLIKIIEEVVRELP